MRRAGVAGAERAGDTGAGVLTFGEVVAVVAEAGCGGAAKKLSVGASEVDAMDGSDHGGMGRAPDSGSSADTSSAAVGLVLMSS